MVLAASLEFEKNHNNQVQERPSDNIELPQVFIKRYTLLFHCNLTYGGRQSRVTPAVTICLVVQIVFMTVYDEKLSIDKVFFIINILNIEWNMNNCSNESFYIVINYLNNFFVAKIRNIALKSSKHSQKFTERIKAL